MLEYAEAAAASASDRLTRACAEILLNPSATRERLTVDPRHRNQEPLVLDGLIDDLPKTGCH